MVMMMMSDSVCMCVCALCVQSLWRPEGGEGSPEVVVTEVSEPHCRCWESIRSSTRAANALTCLAISPAQCSCF